MKLDPIVDRLVMELLKNLRTIPESEFVGRRLQREAIARSATLETLQEQFTQKKKELEGFKEEVRKCMKGESSFDQELLNDLFKECKADVETLSEEIATAEEKIAELEATAASYKAEYDKALSWVELYEDSSIEGKKMILRQLVKKISIREDYSLNIELNFSYKQFEKLLSSPREATQASA